MSYNQNQQFKNEKDFKNYYVISSGIDNCFYNSQDQDIVISARLTRPHEFDAYEMHRPARPDHRYVWVAEGWDSRGGHYAYRKGVWALPPHHGAYWVPGHWGKYQYRAGYKWFPGYWH